MDCFEKAVNLTRYFKEQLRIGGDVDHACVLIATTAAGLDLTPADVPRAKQVIEDIFKPDLFRALSGGRLCMRQILDLDLTTAEGLDRFLAEPEIILQREHGYPPLSGIQVKSVLVHTRNNQTGRGHVVCVRPNVRIDNKLPNDMHLVFDPVGPEGDPPWTHVESADKIIQRARNPFLYLTDDLTVGVSVVFSFLNE